MHNKVFKHLLTLFFVLILLTVFRVHWNAADKTPGIKSEQSSKTLKDEEKIRSEKYLRIFGYPTEFGRNPEGRSQENKTENKNTENK